MAERVETKTLDLVAIQVEDSDPGSSVMTLALIAAGRR